MQITLNPGQTLSIAALALAGGATSLTFEVATPAAAAGKRGPKSLPSSTAKAGDFHASIMKVLRNGKPRSADEIRSAIGGTEETKNAISWALVELQNEGSRRSKSATKTGPLIKLADGRYQKR